MLCLRTLGLASLVALGTTSLACGDSTGSGSDDVTAVPHSSVKDQSSNNCWLYATMGWIESLHMSATGEELNLSESYLTYWHWFDQIVAGEVVGGVVEEGGFFSTASELIIKYGVMAEKDFIAIEGNEAFSQRQAEAVKAINTELKSGALRNGANRRNPALVREALDRAWRLTSTTVGILNRTFGQDVSRTLATNAIAEPQILKGSDILVKLKNPATGNFENRTVLDAIGTRMSDDDIDNRRGPFAWHDEPYPKTKAARRNFWKRVQRALHDNQPVVINWMIDDNAFTPDGRYVDVPATPGPQGGHMVLGFDYAIDNVPGVGSLEAGTLVTDPRVLEAALDDAAQVRFIRVKNSWSATFRPLPAPAPGGFHDLFVKYLDGPMPFCAMNAQEKPILSTCEPGIPLESIVLPAGY